MPITNYVWDSLSDDILMESNEVDVTQAVYTKEPKQFGGLVSQRRDANSNFYHFDGLGSTRELTDSNVNVTDTNMYDAWGVNVSHSGETENPFEWVGEFGYYFDREIRDYSIRKRIYEPEIARWLSIDPKGFGSGDVNLLVYVSNQPVNAIDPSGEASCQVAEFNVKEASQVIHSVKPGGRYFVGTRFDTFAQFVERGNLPYCCMCCSYRQCVKGRTRTRLCPRNMNINCAAWGDARFFLAFEEDCIGQGPNKFCYGHRENKSVPDFDEYSEFGDVNEPKSCLYHGRDYPGVTLPHQGLFDALTQRGRELQIDIGLDFLHRIIDTCKTPNADPCGPAVAVVSEKKTSIKTVIKVQQIRKP